MNELTFKSRLGHTVTLPIRAVREWNTPGLVDTGSLLIQVDKGDVLLVGGRYKFNRTDGWTTNGLTLYEPPKLLGWIQ